MDHLEHGRECYGRRAWGDAYQALLCADQATALQPDDLDRLATAAYLTGRDLEFQRHPGTPASCPCRGGRPSARRALCVLACAHLLASRRDRSGERLDCARAAARRGPRLRRARLPVLSPSPSSNCVRARPMRRTRPQARPSRSASRFDDADLTAAARHAQGRALIEQGDVVAGLKRLDETMLAVVAGELSSDHDGVDVLQRDRHLPAGLCPGPRARMDLRVFARVRATAGDDRVHRHLPRASCRDPAVAGSVAGRADRSLPCL